MKKNLFKRINKHHAETPDAGFLRTRDGLWEIISESPKTDGYCLPTLLRAIRFHRAATASA